MSTARRKWDISRSSVPSHEHYHVQSESLLVEVLDDDGRPSGPGEIGRIVITTLQNFAMPLIRYEIGDYGEVGEPCDCGRGLPVLRRIVGRKRNMAILPDGGRVWPCVSEGLLGQASAKGLPPIRQFQIIQRTLDRVEAVIVPGRPFTPEEESVLRQMVQDALGWPTRVTITYVEEIPRGANGKYEDFRCEVAEAGTPCF